MAVLLYICEKADKTYYDDKARPIVDVQRYLAIFQFVTTLCMIFVSVVNSPSKLVDFWWYSVAPLAFAIFAVLDFVIFPIIIMT
jgi:hypothetical protein